MLPCYFCGKPVSLIPNWFYLTKNVYTININQMTNITDFNFNEPRYFELRGHVAKIEKLANGNVKVTVPNNISIADFMQDGTQITKEAYQRLARSAAKDNAVS